MARCLLLWALCVVVSCSVSTGLPFLGDEECSRELGPCTERVYNYTRLAALRSSNCHDFCHCAHASTELDGSVTYMWVRQECPLTTLFDDSLSSPVCNHDYKVQCHGDDDQDCRDEHGSCTQFIYENVRLVAQKSSGCERFCQCAHASTELDGSVTYMWIEHTCPENTLFNNTERVCSHSHYVRCNVNQVQNAFTSTLRPIVQETTAGIELREREEGNECFEEYGNCNSQQYENELLVALRRSGCKHFCQCAHASTELDGSVTYKWVQMTCPVGTLFDESLPEPVCNHDFYVQCPDDESRGCTEEHDVCTAEIYEDVRLVPKSSSGCEQFCQCAYASTELDGSVTFKWVEHDCPEGTLFNAELKVCDFAEAVECGYWQAGRLLQRTVTETIIPGTESEVPHVAVNSCESEHGKCTSAMYITSHMMALGSSGCQNFCQCAPESSARDGTVIFHWVEQKCPKGTLFDEVDRVCKFADDVEC